MAQEAEERMPVAKRLKDMTPEEKKAYHKEWRSRNTVKARMEQAAARVAARGSNTPPEYFRVKAKEAYAKQREIKKQCPICGSTVIASRFARHETSKKHEKAVDEIRLDNIRLDRMFAELARQSREQNGRA